MVSKMKHDTELGSRIATVHNGSALFAGDAGSGESAIRKHIIANDWLECIIALPKNIFITQVFRLIFGLFLIVRSLNVRGKCNELMLLICMRSWRKIWVIRIVK